MSVNRCASRLLRTARLQSNRNIRNCQYVSAPRLTLSCEFRHCRRFQNSAAQQDAVPLRKHLKDEAKRKKQAAKVAAKSASKGTTKADSRLDGWELTVGIEVHAELNTAHKLFSSAGTSTSAEPNAHVAKFDAALPGSQPQFQQATLLPALRAALALDCEIQSQSSWDRKHYFYQDQPNGYQITQYYAPFARNGSLTLALHDGVDPSDVAENGDDASITIGIKQVQMEQDTAKTAHQLPSTYLLDFNRVSHPLIEIITLPHIHSPATAAATVRKIQSLLKSVDACVAGMEVGGLRADVNVSVRRRGSTDGIHEYGGVTGLGTRTEIKNLSSFKAVEEAVAAERDRQIAVLEAGGVIEGETRGWTIGSTETTRLRSKEGEVDYRYMPDPDLGRVLIGNDLISHLKRTLPELPDETVARAMRDFDLSLKDAKTLVSLDDGERLDYCAEAVDLISSNADAQTPDPAVGRAKTGKTVANWVLHEIGGLLTSDPDSNSSDWIRAREKIAPAHLAAIIANLTQKSISARTAKQLLAQLYGAEDGDHSDNAGTGVGGGERKTVDQIIDEGNLRLRPMSEEEYKRLASAIMEENPEMVRAIRDKGQKGKAMFFVGQMMRRADEGTVEAETARKVVEALLGI